MRPASKNLINKSLYYVATAAASSFSLISWKNIAML